MLDGLRIVRLAGQVSDRHLQGSREGNLHAAFVDRLRAGFDLRDVPLTDTGESRQLALAEIPLQPPMPDSNSDAVTAHRCTRLESLSVTT